MSEYPSFEPKYIEDEETVRARFNLDADPDVDKRDTSFFQITTEPPAREFSRFWDVLNDVIALRSFMYANGLYLDYLAANYGVVRRDSTPASVVVTITGEDGTIIPSGSRFSTTATAPDDIPARFIVTTGGTISGGTLDVTMQAEENGLDGNVAAGSINFNDDSLPGIESISNPLAATGGTDVEEDDEMRLRIQTFLQTPLGAGNVYDYIRWASEISGVSSSVQVVPVWNGPNTVLVVIMDSNGDAASSALLTQVQEHLSGPPKISNPSTAPTAAVGAGGALTGSFIYAVTFCDQPASVIAKGETKPSPASAPVSPAAQKVGLTAIPVGPLGTESRRIYRSDDSGDTWVFLDAIDDNVTTVYEDNEPTPPGDTVPFPATNNTTNFTGQAPVGALVNVRTAEQQTVDIAATIIFEDGYDLDGTGDNIALRDPLEAALSVYVNSLKSGDPVVYQHTASIFFDVEGVFDISDLLVDGGTSNVAIPATRIARVGTITLSE